MEKSIEETIIKDELKVETEFFEDQTIIVEEKSTGEAIVEDELEAAKIRGALV